MFELRNLDSIRRQTPGPDTSWRVFVRFRKPLTWLFKTPPLNTNKSQLFPFLIDCFFCGLALTVLGGVGDWSADVYAGRCLYLAISPWWLDLDPPPHDNYAITNNQQTTLQWLGWAGGGAEGETTKKSVLTSEYLGTAGSITTETLPPISQSNDKHCLLNNSVMRL